MEVARRSMLAGGMAFGALWGVSRGWAQPAPTRAPDRVYICNEDSNTLAVIDPEKNVVVETVNLTSFD